MTYFKPPAASVSPGPAAHGFSITPDDANDLPHLTRMIYVGSSGNLVVILAGDDDPVTLPALQGNFIEVCARRVMTASSASALVGLW